AALWLWRGHVRSPVGSIRRPADYEPAMVAVTAKKRANMTSVCRSRRTLTDSTDSQARRSIFWDGSGRRRTLVARSYMTVPKIHQTPPAKIQFAGQLVRIRSIVPEKEN